MPPRRHPRSWLADRLRSAAGAVQRLAGRVEPAGQLPAPPPVGVPVATPRRFGEPPQHWLDLVANHAPGLLHDLDLDPRAAEPAERPDDPAGGPGFGDRVDQDGPNRWTATTRPTQPVGEGAGLPDDPVGRPAPSAGGRRTPGTVGRRATGTVERPGRATSMRGPDLTAHSDGRGSAAPATHGTVGNDATVGAAYGVDGPEVVSGGARPDGSRSTGGTGRSVYPSSATDRSGSPGTSGASPRGSSDASEVASTAEAPLASDADRRPPGRLLDGWRLRPPSGRIAATGPARDARPPADPSELPRIGQSTYPTPTEILEDFGPSRGTFLPRSTTDFADVSGPDRRPVGGEVAAADGGRWPALPDDRARQQVGDRAGYHTGHRNGPTARAAGAGWIGAAHRDPGGGRGPESGLFQPDATALDPWPALPDDTALWSVTGAPLDAAQPTRLDREQAGD
ncbi:hypothetical protein [Micromonospora sp. NPDC050276]|uniref:hypothetical protein n=1 Tax=Micromonospora sp. NPDC050276 TaxID=3364278 RepID=UPI0037AB06C1